MGWTYWEYMDSPVWFIDTIQIKIACENRVTRAMNNMNKNR